MDKTLLWVYLLVKNVSKWTGLYILPVIVFVSLIWLLIPAPLSRDHPRELPWSLPDYRQADSHWEVGADGRIYTEVEHFFLSDISPAMIAWFYQQLPISTIQYKGITYPLYHIFHPTEHGRIRVLEAAASGVPGMATGATIHRDEWFGPYDSRGTAQIVDLSETGMFAIPMAGSLKLGEVRHIFTPVDGGTRYRVKTVIGSELPVLGPLLNWYLRNKVFHPEMLQEWQRHQIEEVASLQFFLPRIYAQRATGTHFVLD